MNSRNGTMSPVSVDGSDWSGIGQYQNGAGAKPPDSAPYSPSAPGPTPPASGGGNPGPNNGLNVNAPNGNGAPRSHGADQGGMPSPPASVAGPRSSQGTLSDQQSVRYRRMEESLAQHYTALRRFLGNGYPNERSTVRSNKARDKLLRLSPAQFHELSTDVYDELIRRQQAAGGPNRPPRPDVPPCLPPRPDFHEKRNQARQKLASLQPGRFRDLATDVLTELERRFPQFAQMDPMAPRGPPPPNGFRGSSGHPPNGYPGGPRPASRGPGGRGPPPPNGRFPPRQQSLSGDPMAMNDGNAPLPKSFQSNTIVPNKSTMVEDDDDDGPGIDSDYDNRSDAFALDGVLPSRRDTQATMADKKQLAEAQSQVASLQERIEELEKTLKVKDEEISRLQDEHEKSQISSLERQEWEDTKADLESKVAQIESLNNSLQSELERERAERSEMERDLREQLEAAQSMGGGGDLQGRYNDLEMRHQTMQSELREQQRITEEVRREAASFLKEMRAMSERSAENWEREEKLSREVNRLEEEVKEWKTRYIRAKTQLRHMRTSSVGLGNVRPTVSREHELMSPTGMVKDMHVTKFQTSIDELLRVARTAEPGTVLDQMKTVVAAVRHITQDLERATSGGGAEQQQLTPAQRKAKSRVSATANNLITASKNYASSGGLSPVSLLDAAASHLTTAVIELLRLVKIRPTPAEELEEANEDEDVIGSPGYFSVAPSQSRMSNNDSIYSAISSPSVRSRTLAASRRRTISRSGIIPPTSAANQELTELKLYLDEQTEGLVQTIQGLVGSIRAGEPMPALRSHLVGISGVVGNVVSATERAIHNNPQFRERLAPVVQNLAASADRLKTAYDDSSSDAGASSRLPPIAFEVARETRELVSRVDQLLLPPPPPPQQQQQQQHQPMPAVANGQLHGDEEDDDFR